MADLNFDFDPEKMKQDQDDANNRKLLLQGIGAAGQALVSSPTAYELLKHTKMDRPDIAGTMNNMAKNIEDPTERQAKLYQAYKSSMEGKELERQDRDHKQLDDPNSQVSKAYKAYALSKGIQIDPSSSGNDVLKLIDPKRMQEIEAQSAVDMNKQAELAKINHVYQMKENDLNRKNSLDKIILEENLKNQKKSDPQARMQALGSGDKARFDNALMVAKALDAMGTALDNGDSTFSTVGDNDYTNAERKAAEAFGRMQSGGAINKEEEKRFLEMLPRATDSAEMQRKKILQQREEMISRLKTLGFSPQDIGYAPKEFTYGANDDEIKDILANREADKAPAVSSKEQADKNRIAAQLELAKRIRARQTKEAKR